MHIRTYTDIYACTYALLNLEHTHTHTQALLNLEHNFSFVGLTEEWDASMELME